MANVEKIDPLIVETAEHWRLSRMAALDRLILRLAIGEFLDGDTPRNVVINEALELAKTFSGDESAKFVNGILDAVKKKLPMKIAWIGRLKECCWIVGVLTCVGVQRQLADAWQAPPGAPSPVTPTFSILVFSKTAGFRHDSIPAGIAAIRQQGSARGSRSRQPRTRARSPTSRSPSTRPSYSCRRPATC